MFPVYGNNYGFFSAMMKNASIDHCLSQQIIAAPRDSVL